MGFFLIDRLIRLLLTFTVSTITIKWVFSRMKLIKTLFSNKIDNNFLANTIIIYIEKKIAFGIDIDFLLPLGLF